MNNAVEKIENAIYLLCEADRRYPYSLTVPRSDYEAFLKAISRELKYAKVINRSNLDGIYFKGVFIRPRSALHNEWTD